MRLMKTDIKTFEYSRAAPEQCGYVGTEEVYRVIGTVSGTLTPMSDNLSVERWGEKSVGMYRLTVLPEFDIRQSDRISIDGADYTVVSVIKYSDHTDAELTREEAYNGGN